MIANFAVIVPMANESLEFSEFTEKLSEVFTRSLVLVFRNILPIKEWFYFLLNLTR